MKLRNVAPYFLALSSLAWTISECIVEDDQQSSAGLGLCQGQLHPQEPLVISEGGWETRVDSIRVGPGPCNIPILDGKTLTQEDFLKSYAFNQPILIRDVTDNTVFRALCAKKRLLRDWGWTSVTLSSANTHSYEKKTVDLKEYLDSYLKPQEVSTPANETFYFFGDNDRTEWKSFFDQYQVPRLSLPGHDVALSFGIAGPGSGVPFHFHGPGFAETLYGRKRWFLTRPEVVPNFHPNETTLHWYLEDYDAALANGLEVFECTVRPGEVIYFPDRWWHATLNIDTSVFISTFLSPLNCDKRGNY